MNRDLTEKTLHSLLSGSHPLAKKYAGKQVFVVDKEIIPIGRSTKSLSDFKQLKIKHGKSPVAVFVPQPGASYILILK
ncbi:hypothetical protein HYZ05_00425 [Candidatus Daviesbacteria bacterium]|nr:hypothetical protein [Candidatus Daviesbacteria bacterium]